VGAVRGLEVGAAVQAIQSQNVPRHDSSECSMHKQAPPVRTETATPKRTRRSPPAGLAGLGRPLLAPQEPRDKLLVLHDARAVGHHVGQLY